MQQTGERMVQAEVETEIEHLWMERHRFAYLYAIEVAKRLPSHASILDIGCGDGYGSAMLAEQLNSCVVGFDHDAETIQAARAQHGAMVGFERGDALRLPFHHEFDMVTCFQMIEHVADGGEVLAGIAHALKPGGVLVLTTPNRVYRLQPGQRPWNRWHLHEYYAAELSALLSRFFSTVWMCGVRGTPEAEELERGRVAAMRKHRLIGWVRRVMPESSRRLLTKTRLFRCDKTSTRHFTPDDFRVVRGEEVENSLDLLAVCAR